MTAGHGASRRAVGQRAVGPRDVGRRALQSPAQRHPALRRVLLVTPPYHCGMVESAGVWMPLGLAYLAGSLRAAGFEPSIYDAMSLFHDLGQIRTRLAREQPDVVAVTACTPTVNAALDVLRAARQAVPGVLTVIGGVHPSHLAGEVLAEEAVDYVVRGEGETTLPSLLTCLGAGEQPSRIAGLSYRAGKRVVATPNRPLAGDLDRLPVAWDLVDWPTYYYRTKPGSRLAIASWSRGCTEACSFCSQQRFWRRTWRARDAEAVVAETRFLRERYGVDTLEVVDECPTRDRARWEHILDRLIEEDLGVELLVETRADDVVRDADIIGKYRAAGILHMYVGVESVRQDRLDGMRKNLNAADSRRAIELLNDAGIITETSFLFGFPGDTRQAVREALDRSADFGPDLAFFLAATPWPYADWYAQVADRVEVFDYSRYNLINPIIRPDDMSRAELAGLLSQAFARFYGNKMRTLGSLDPAKRDYLLRVARLLMENSYLAGEAAASMPPAMREHLAAVGVGVPGRKSARNSNGAPAGRPGVRPLTMGEERGAARRAVA